PVHQETLIGNSIIRPKISEMREKTLRTASRRSTYFLQNAGERTTSRVKISSRPSSMAAVHTQVWKSLSDLKVLAGPTSPRPGPVLLKLATTAENPVTTSRPEKTISRVNETMITM